MTTTTAPSSHLQGVIQAYNILKQRFHTLRARNVQVTTERDALAEFVIAVRDDKQNPKSKEAQKLLNRLMPV